MALTRCEEIQPNLLDYGQGLLSASEAKEVEQHLDKCAECKAVLAEELAFANRLTALPAEEPKNDVWALVRAQTKPRRFGIGSLRDMVTGPAMIRKALALTAAVGVVFGVLYTGLKPEEPKQIVKQTQTTTVAVGWSDDPLGDHTDAMVKFIDDM